MAKNVLFLITEAGNGHRSVAESISFALNELNDGLVSCKIVDFFGSIELPVLQNIASLYCKVTNDYLPLYDIGFRLTNNIFFLDRLSRLVYRASQKKILQLLRSLKPNLVVVAQPFMAANLLCKVRQNYNLNFGINVVISDLISLHTSWIHPKVDLYFVPTSAAFEFATFNGISPKSIKLVSFPVHPKFHRCNPSKVSAMRVLGIDEARFTILITGGGVAIGHFKNLISKLEDTFPTAQLLVIAGKNRKAYYHLGERHKPNSHFYGYVDNMETFMMASDVVISKAGPSTIMEAATLRRPLIVTKAVGKQEHGNINFILENHLGVVCPSSAQVIDAVSSLIRRTHYEKESLLTFPDFTCQGSMEIAQVILQQLTRGHQPIADCSGSVSYDPMVSLTGGGCHVGDPENGAHESAQWVAS